jgi:hypothetical protein
MVERRSSSKVKAWMFFLLELAIFISLGAMIIFFLGTKFGLPAALLLVGGLIYKTKSFQRLEKILRRTEDIRRNEMQEKYGDHT